MLHLYRPRQTARETNPEYLENNLDHKEALWMWLTWMTIGATQVMITATTLSSRMVASISRHPVWYRASVSGGKLDTEVMLLLTSQDTGTSCSASFLQTMQWWKIYQITRIMKLLSWCLVLLMLTQTLCWLEAFECLASDSPPWLEGFKCLYQYPCIPAMARGI